MRIARWHPKEERSTYFERPYLEAPSPYDYMPLEPPEREEEEEEETPRVIIIDM